VGNRAECIPLLSHANKTTGNEISDKALAKAFEFAGAFDAEIILLHVIEQVPVPPTIMLGNDPVLIARTKREITKKLDEEWKKMAQEKIIGNLDRKESAKEVKTTVSVVHGSPVKEITKFADDSKVDIIVMGSNRLENLSKIKGLGSVARNVSETATCPVTIVH
jgi:nucleotide-binding universal stress UspA family protein